VSGGGWWARCSDAASRRWSEAQGARRAVLQWEKFPSRVEAGDGDNQLVDAGRNGMPRVVGEMGDCGGMEGVGWLQMRTHASCVLCLLARDRKFRRSLSEGQAIMADGWRHQRRLAHRRHHPITKRTVTSRLHFTHRLVLPHEPGLVLSSLLPHKIQHDTAGLASIGSPRAV
jgi:hypothetical protein